MNCLWILVLLCLCSGTKGGCDLRENDCGHKKAMSAKDDCGCEKSKPSKEDCGCSPSRRFSDDKDMCDMPCGGEMGRMPSNFQRGTFGCEMQES